MTYQIAANGSQASLAPRVPMAADGHAVHVEAAIAGRPVEAGRALRALDDQTGSRHATDTLVRGHGAPGGAALPGQAGSASYLGGRHAAPDGSPGTKTESKYSAQNGTPGVSSKTVVEGGGGKVSNEDRVEVDSSGARYTNTKTVEYEAGGKVATANVVVTNKTVVETRTNPDGTTTYSVEADTKVTGGVAIDPKSGKPVSVEVEGTVGGRTKYSVTVPPGVDPRTIDPTRPESWPAGTRVQMKAEDYQGTALEIAFAKAGVKVGVGGEGGSHAGTSIVMERHADGRIGVAVGPTSGFSSSGKLMVGIPDAGISVEAGVGYSYEAQRFTSFTIDPANPAGRRALEDFLYGGRLPTENGGGVSDVVSIQTGDWSNVATGKVTTPWVVIGGEELRYARSTVVRTYPDGRVEMSESVDVDGDGRPDLVKTATSADGTNWSPVEYKVSLRFANEADVNKARNLTGNPDLKVGDTLEITLSSAEVEAMRNRTRDFTGGASETERGGLRSRYAAYALTGGGNASVALDEMFSHGPQGMDDNDPDAVPTPPTPGDCLPGSIEVRTAA